MTGKCSFDLESIDEEGKPQLVTGRIGAGKTSFGVSLAEQEDEIISNLESIEGAFYANSPNAIWNILLLNPHTRFAVLLDDITASLSYDAEGRLKSSKIVELVSDLVGAGHRVILTGTVLDDFPDELLYFGEGEWDDAARDAYHLPERGQAEYREIYRIGGQLDTETVCSFPAARPSRSFDSQEISDFEIYSVKSEFALPESPEDEDDSDGGYFDDVFADDKIPPQFHLDELERKLDYNLGQVDGFHDLDWKSKCKLAKIAVENDLSLEEAEVVLDPSVSELETILKLSQRDRDSDELPDSWDIAEWLEYLLGLLHEGDDARDSDV